MNKYKTFEELKEELGDEFEDFLYKANIELLTKIDNAIEYIKKESWFCYKDNKEVLDRTPVEKLLNILGDNKEWLVVQVKKN